MYLCLSHFSPCLDALRIKGFYPGTCWKVYPGCNSDYSNPWYRRNLRNVAAEETDQKDFEASNLIPDHSLQCASMKLKMHARMSELADKMEGNDACATALRDTQQLECVKYYQETEN